jgi:hypothetical protein
MWSYIKYAGAAVIFRGGHSELSRIDVRLRVLRNFRSAVRTARELGTTTNDFLDLTLGRERNDGLLEIDFQQPVCNRQGNRSITGHAPVVNLLPARARVWQNRSPTNYGEKRVAIGIPFATSRSPPRRRRARMISTRLAW